MRLAGEVSDKKYMSELQEEIKCLSITEHVEFQGRISQSALMQELAAATVFVLPSYQENAPMVIAEAMAVGVPVIASRLCGIPDMVQDGRTGYLIEPDDIEDIANKIVSLLSDDRLRAKMGDAAKEVAYETYHAAAIAEATLDIYGDIIREYHESATTPCC